jgi:hypothetical protein
VHDVAETVQALRILYAADSRAGPAAGPSSGSS